MQTFPWEETAGTSPEQENWIFSTPWPPACRTSTNWPRASLRKARAWLSPEAVDMLSGLGSCRDAQIK